jgi:hypothetical protein
VPCIIIHESVSDALMLKCVPRTRRRPKERYEAPYPLPNLGFVSQVVWILVGFHSPTPTICKWPHGVHGRREGLAQPCPGSSGQHQTLVGYLQELRTDMGVAEEALLEPQEREIQHTQEFGVGQVGEGLLEIILHRPPRSSASRQSICARVGERSTKRGRSANYGGPPYRGRGCGESLDVYLRVLSPLRAAPL